MKHFPIARIGLALMLVLLGYGGCCCLLDLGRSFREPKKLIHNFPDLTPTRK